MAKKPIDVIRPNYPIFPLLTRCRGNRPPLVSPLGKRNDYRDFREMLAVSKPTEYRVVLIDCKHAVNTGHGKKTHETADKGWFILGPGDNIFYLTDEQFNEYFTLIEGD